MWRVVERDALYFKTVDVQVCSALCSPASTSASLSRWMDDVPREAHVRLLRLLNIVWSAPALALRLLIFDSGRSRTCIPLVWSALDVLPKMYRLLLVYTDLV